MLQARNEGKLIYILRMDADHDAQINGRTHEEIIDDIKEYTTFLSCRTGSTHDTDSEINAAQPASFSLCSLCMCSEP